MDSSSFSQAPGSLLFLPFRLAQNGYGEVSAAAPVVVDADPPAPVTPPATFPRKALEPLGDPKSLVRLFGYGDMVEASERNRTQGPRNKADRDNLQALLDHLFALGTHRRCALPDDWRHELEQLKATHPNFAAVVDLVASEFTLAEASKKPAVLPPILLDGPPGCGKTYFAEALSDVMETGFLRVNLETGQTPSELTGTAAHWGNSQPGRLFDLLVNGQHSNPVVLLDEADKAGGASGQGIDRALYALLEPGSAKEWADACLPTLKMDLRHVIWILTSNDRRCIPTALLSRMQVFEIRAPSRAESLAMARRIFESTADEFHCIEFSSEITTPLLAMLALYPARVVRRFSRALVAAAVKDHRNFVTSSDFTTVGADRAVLDVFGSVNDEAAFRH